MRRALGRLQRTPSPCLWAALRALPLPISLTFALCLVAALAAPGRARAGSVRLQLQDLQCPDPSEVAARLERELAAASENDPEVFILVDTPSPSQLRVRADSPQESRERVIEFQRRDCVELPDTVAMLLHRWLDRGWSEPPPGASPSSSSSSSAAASSAAAASTSAAPATSATSARSGGLRTLVPYEGTPAASAAPSPSSSGARIVLAAGLFSGVPDGHTGPMGTLSGEWDFSSRFGLALQIAGNAPVDSTLGPGRVSVGLGRVSLLLRASVRGSNSAFVDLLAGPGVCFLVARGSGFSGESRGQTVRDASLLAAARWRQRLTDEISAIAGLEIDVNRETHSFTAVNVPTAFDLSPARATAFIGVGFNFD